ncbi:hypothetical protein T484DRAFT_1875108, partial [Baffinella frigidus]
MSAVFACGLGRARADEACEWLKRWRAAAESPDASGWLALPTGRAAEAVDAFAAAAKAGPSGAALSNLGASLLEAHRPREAAEVLARALALSPSLAAALTSRGYALAEVGDLRGARESLQRAVEVDPSHATGHNNLGHFLRAHTADAAAAVHHGREAVRLAPNAAAHHFNLAESLRLALQMTDAIRHLNLATELDPGLLEARALLSFYRRLVCDWSSYREDVAWLEATLNSQRFAGEQSALFAVQTLVFPLSPLLHRFAAASLATRASARAAHAPLPLYEQPGIPRTSWGSANKNADPGVHEQELRGVAAHAPLPLCVGGHTEPGSDCRNVVWSSPNRVGVPLLPTLPRHEQAPPGVHEQELRGFAAGVGAGGLGGGAG